MMLYDWLTVLGCLLWLSLAAIGLIRGHASRDRSRLRGYAVLKARYWVPQVVLWPVIFLVTAAGCAVCGLLLALRDVIGIDLLEHVQDD